MKHGCYVRVLASGVFDLVHYGHIHFLKEAKKAGGDRAYLIVVVARDKTVVKFKGRHPVLPEDQRRAIVEALKPVDKAILGLEDFNIEQVLYEIKPDIIAVGYDQNDLEKNVKQIITEKGLDIAILHISKFRLSGLESSSKIKNKIVN